MTPQDQAKLDRARNHVCLLERQMAETNEDRRTLRKRVAMLETERNTINAQLNHARKRLAARGVLDFGGEI